MYLSDEVFEELGVTVELASEVSVVTVCAQFVSLNKTNFQELNITYFLFEVVNLVRQVAHVGLDPVGFPIVFAE